MSRLTTWTPAGLISLISLISSIATLALAEPPAHPGGLQIRVAAISMVPRKLDLAWNAQRLEQLFRQAADGGAQLAVAPEGVLEGYIVNEIIAGQIAAQRMHGVALTLDAPPIVRFQQLAQELSMCLVFGFAERVGDDVYNCAIFIDHAGRICGTYHKMQLAEGYTPQWWFNRLGQRSRAIDTPFGRCGILICNDRWNPDLARIPVLDGAQFLVIPSYGSRSRRQDEAVLSRARENDVPLVEANVGVSMIVSRGQIVTLKRDDEGIAFGEIHIAGRTEADAGARDALERAFLEWRDAEMPARYEQHMAKLRADQSAEATSNKTRID